VETIILIGILCFFTGLFIGHWRERKKIFKKIIPEDIWRFHIQGVQSTNLCRGTLTVYSNRKRITKVEFHRA